MAPLQWMGAVTMRVQKADKNITSNPQLSGSSITFLWSEKLCVCRKQRNKFCVFVGNTVKEHIPLGNKFIIKVFLALNCYEMRVHDP